MSQEGLPVKQGLYNPEFEHDSCGVGFVVNLNGVKSHLIINQGLEVLSNLAHRGACGCDPETGDGAGILVQIPDEFFREKCGDVGFKLPPSGDYGVAMVFLPQDDNNRKPLEDLLERVVIEEGLSFLGWRTVPVNNKAIGSLARESEPIIRQLFVSIGSSGCRINKDLDRKLYVILKLAESKSENQKFSGIQNFYISSFSNDELKKSCLEYL